MHLSIRWLKEAPRGTPLRLPVHRTITAWKAGIWYEQLHWTSTVRIPDLHIFPVYTVLKYPVLQKHWRKAMSGGRFHYLMKPTGLQTSRSGGGRSISTPVLFAVCV